MKDKRLKEGEWVEFGAPDRYTATGRITDIRGNTYDFDHVKLIKDISKQYVMSPSQVHIGFSVPFFGADWYVRKITNIFQDVIEHFNI